MSVLVAFGGKCRPNIPAVFIDFKRHFWSWFFNPFNWNLRKRQCISAVLLSGKKNFFNVPTESVGRPSRLSFTKHSGSLETRASGIKISLEIFRKHSKLLNTTKMKNAFYSQKNLEILWEKSNGTEVPSETFSEISFSELEVERGLTPFARFESWRPSYKKCFQINRVIIPCVSSLELNLAKRSLDDIRVETLLLLFMRKKR